MIVAWGDRIGLRPFQDPLTDEEIERVYRWSSDPAVLRWSGGAPTELGLAEFRNRILEDHTANPSNRRAFFIVNRAGELIGRVGVFAIDWVMRQGELGIVIGESNYWGKGYGRDVVMTLLHHVFENTSLESINLFTFTDNVRAQQCFAACGFRVVGTGRRFSPDIGEFEGIEMELTRSEFLTNPLPRPHSSNKPISQEEK